MMNSTELDEGFESALVFTQHACGAVMLIFNGWIVMMIIEDPDKRNKHYRKYLCWVQISSLVFDAFSDFYAPIFMAHRGIIYSNSLLSKLIGTGVFMTIEFILLAEVVLSYFACVFYRRGIVLGPNRRFSYTGRARVALFIFLHLYGFLAITGMIYFTKKSLQAAENSFPRELEWVKKKSTYLFMLPDEYSRYATYAIAPIADSVVLAVIAMLVQLVLEMRKTDKFTSAATRRYQRMAVRSLVLQGTVPTLLYVLPSYGNTCLQFAPAAFEVGEYFNRLANVLSPIFWIIFTKHTFASSLIILSCSTSYRRKIAKIITHSKNPLHSLPSPSLTVKRIERTL